jgi:hypothetical protein
MSRPYSAEERSSIFGIAIDRLSGLAWLRRIDPGLPPTMLAACIALEAPGEPRKIPQELQVSGRT